MSMYFIYNRGDHRHVFDPGSDPAGFRVIEIATKLKDGLYALKPSDADKVAAAVTHRDDEFIVYLRQRKNSLKIYHKD